MIKMTLKEFSDQYKIPYHIVYEASYKVHPISTDLRDREWPENELLVETHNLVCDRIKYHQEMLDKNNVMKKRLEGVW